MKNSPCKLMRHLAAVICIALFSSFAFGAATIVIVNTNAPGEGFNDPTPATPVGGNTGTTIGEQRLIAFQYAADIWGANLNSNVPIYVESSFVPLSCTTTSAVLGSAGPLEVFSDFPGERFGATWYHVALANKLAGEDLSPDGNDIIARFNSLIGTDPNCLTGVGWYYGLDNSHGTDIDLVTVLLHEFAHGLGFSTFVDKTTGENFFGQTDIYARFIRDNTLGKKWLNMKAPQRAASAVNSRRVVWTGSAVRQGVRHTLIPGTPLLKVTSPAGIAGNYDVGAAAFGPPLSSPGVSGNVVLADDGAGGTSACTALANAGAIAGNIALVDRGTCTFTVKVKNAQNAGAIAVVVADNVAGSPPSGLGGTDPTITIPSVRVSLADGNTIKGQLSTGVSATLGVDLSIRAGADTSDRALLFTPNPVQLGSTISHWDTIAFPNLLMEPAINGDLTHSLKPPQDLTLKLMKDIGW